MLTIWFVILVPWFPVFTVTGTGMAFEGGDAVGAYFFVVIAWTYPALVAISYFFRRRKPRLIWLPMLPLVSLVFASIFSN